MTGGEEVTVKTSHTRIRPERVDQSDRRSDRSLRNREEELGWRRHRIAGGKIADAHRGGGFETEALQIQGAANPADPGVEASDYGHPVGRRPDQQIADGRCRHRDRGGKGRSNEDAGLHGAHGVIAVVQAHEGESAIGISKCGPVIGAGQSVVDTHAGDR
jgi:hypothetical protein